MVSIGDLQHLCEQLGGGCLPGEEMGTSSPAAKALPLGRAARAVLLVEAMWVSL